MNRKVMNLRRSSRAQRRSRQQKKFAMRLITKAVMSSIEAYTSAVAEPWMSLPEDLRPPVAERDLRNDWF